MGAKELKAAILQEAVQGKLVPQIASEGNARDLLEEIRKARHSELQKCHSELVSESKSKKMLKQVRHDNITEDEIPFDIPENWCWCRLGEICNLTSGQDLIPEQYNSQNKGIPYITGASNFSNENIIVNRWTEYARAIAEENDLLLTCKGTVGEMAFLHEKKVHIARQIMGLRFEKRIDSKYMKYFITTQINDLKSKAKSMIPGIARDDVIKLPIPLPPLAEQKRIVAALEQFMPLIEEYGKKETELKAFNEQIGTLAKKAILQEAVQGKLVPQIKSEGNAKDLLDEIRKARHSELQKCHSELQKCHSELVSESKGKSKNKKMLKQVQHDNITDDEIPFDIPESWCWCRLGELGTFVRGSGIKRTETTDKGFPCVRYGEMYTTYKTQFSKTKSFTSKEVFDKCHKINKNDILMALTGENKWDIALAAVYQGNDELALGGDLCKFTPLNVHSLFLVYIINSPFGIEQKRNTATGDIIVHISAEKLGNMLIPLPPLAEQKRIVAAIEKLLPLCGKLGAKEK